jgi:hypothetical protein
MKKPGKQSIVYLSLSLFTWLFNANIRHRRFYRLFTNTLNTSVAFLIIGMMLRGIIDIAGSASVYIVWYFNVALIGFILAIGLFLLMLVLPRVKSIKAK